MPVPTQPLTPLSSTDIASQDKQHAGPVDASLKLPPPALRSAKTSKQSSSGPANAESEEYSNANVQSGRKRKRSSLRETSPAEPNQLSYSLPPPPTRSRTIIQMQPGVVRGEKNTATSKTVEKSKSEGNKRGAAGSGGKRAARKTAHSVIERRRRSKMNEEFETMKEMIPACKGHTMHKLAILQAGIEYLRYLEQCVSDLKVAKGHTSSRLETELDGSPAQSRHNSEHESDDTSEDEEEAYDQQQESGSTKDDQGQPQSEAWPTTPRTEASYRPESLRESSYVHASPEFRAYSSRPLSSSGLPSALPSPIIPSRPQGPHERLSQASGTLSPQESRKADIEATAALLMLNGDRGASGKSGRGLSVQDLLSG